LPVQPLSLILDALAAFHGPLEPGWPTDPYLFLVWWHCGYPASDACCARGWESLTNRIGVEPARLLAAAPAQLAMALKAGGMMPELRALRLKEIAERIEKRFDGDLRTALRALPLAKARTELKKFPGIADPGADRILLFGGISPLAAVPSNCAHVLVRIDSGPESGNYGATYRQARDAIAARTPAAFDARTRAYLLLKHHGQTICKRANPKCTVCPVAANCVFACSVRK
jgi:endonuclease-3